MAKITRQDVKKAGSLRDVYLNRAAKDTASGRDLDIAGRLLRRKQPVVKALPKQKKSRLLDVIGAKDTQSKILRRKKALKVSLSY